jgi:hypothetical protein
MQEVAPAAACPTRQLSGARLFGDVKHGMSPKLILPQPAARSNRMQCPSRHLMYHIAWKERSSLLMQIVCS